MKQIIKYIFLLLILCLPLMAEAQKMNVVSFAPDMTDMTANLEGTIVYDQNGDKCALIKIETTEKGFTFDVGMLGIVKTEYHPGEIWLYVPYGVKSITISHPTFGVLRDYDMGMSVKQARTYILKLTTAKIVGGYIEEDLGGNYLTLVIEPKNAEVFIDEEMVAVDAHGVASTWLKYGIHKYEIFAPMHKRATGTVTISNETAIEQTITLKPNYSIVTITAPNQADIYVNNQKKGTGSWEGKLGAGEYMVEARKESHLSTKTTIKVATGENISKTLEAPIPRYGVLNIQTSPAKATLLIDGKEIGSTPGIYRNVLIGEHKVTLKKEGYETLTKTINIEEGKVVSENLTLQQKKIVQQPVVKQESKAISGIHNGHEYVDLGLSVKWATCNVGADTPEEYGDYFAWGETITKSSYSSSNYTYSSNSATLPLSADAARVNWGGNWRMPTKAEQKELRNTSNCTWTWTTQNGVKGYKVTSKKNGNSIFLPAAGFRDNDDLYYADICGYYWSSSLNKYNSYNAYYLYFNSSNEDWNYGSRCSGQSVRAVCD